MIKKLLILTLCLSLYSCGGYTYVAGLKFKKEAGAKTHGGNPGFISDTVKLYNGMVIGFNRPIGKCGAGITFFGILLPVFPVGVTVNRCENNFDIDISGLGVSDAKLKYNNAIYDPISIEKLIETHEGMEGYKYEYGSKFKFKIENFWKFRMADDKAIIVSGKTKDGKDFTEELPVKWGVMTYYNWAIP